MDERIKDFVYFRKMLTPLIIQIVFWVGAVAAFVGGIATMFNGGFWRGLLIALLGPFIVRIFSELILVTFKINGTLTDIRNEQLKKTTENPIITSAE